MNNPGRPPGCGGQTARGSAKRSAAASARAPGAAGLSPAASGTSQLPGTTRHHPARGAARGRGRGVPGRGARRQVRPRVRARIGVAAGCGARAVGCVRVGFAASDIDRVRGAGEERRRATRDARRARVTSSEFTRGREPRRGAGQEPYPAALSRARPGAAFRKALPAGGSEPTRGWELPGRYGRAAREGSHGVPRPARRPGTALPVLAAFLCGRSGDFPSAGRPAVTSARVRWQRSLRGRVTPRGSSCSSGCGKGTAAAAGGRAAAGGGRPWSPSRGALPAPRCLGTSNRSGTSWLSPCPDPICAAETANALKGGGGEGRLKGHRGRGFPADTRGPTPPHRGATGGLGAVWKRRREGSGRRNGSDPPAACVGAAAARARC